MKTVNPPFVQSFFMVVCLFLVEAVRLILIVVFTLILGNWILQNLASFLHVTQKSPPDISIEFATGTLASFLGVFFVLYLDRQTRPKLQIATISDDDENEDDAYVLDSNGVEIKERRKFLHVNVTNPPLWPIHSFFQDRHTAGGTHANIDFYRLCANPNKLELLFRIPAKWRDNQLPPFLDEYQKKGIHTLPRGFVDTREIPAGNGMRNHLDVAIKIRGQYECWPYNLESALYPNPNCHPDRKLTDQAYLLRVELRSGGKVFRHYIKLLNRSPYEDLQLVEISFLDKLRYRRLL